MNTVFKMHTSVCSIQRELKYNDTITSKKRGPKSLKRWAFYKHYKDLNKSKRCLLKSVKDSNSLVELAEV